MTALLSDDCGAVTCDSLWTGAMPGRVTGAPGVVAGTVVVGALDGTVTAFGLPQI